MANEVVERLSEDPIQGHDRLPEVRTEHRVSTIYARLGASHLPRERVVCVVGQTPRRRSWKKHALCQDEDFHGKWSLVPSIWAVEPGFVNFSDEAPDSGRLASGCHQVDSSAGEPSCRTILRNAANQFEESRGNLPRRTRTVSRLRVSFPAVWLHCHPLLIVGSLVATPVALPAEEWLAEGHGPPREDRVALGLDEGARGAATRLSIPLRRYPDRVKNRGASRYQRRGCGTTASTPTAAASARTPPARKGAGGNISVAVESRASSVNGALRTPPLCS
jgi:hypothetical protein